jgi:hypothetical protein
MGNIIARLPSLALSLAPYAGLGALIQYSRTKLNLEENLKATPLLRMALWVHFLYFIGVPINLEVFPDVPGIDKLVGSVEYPATTNGLHMMTCLAAENFFVTSTALGFLLYADQFPRWTMMPVFAQLAWNLKNHLSWYFIPLAPEGRMPFALVDMVLIWPITAIYGHFYFTAASNDGGVKKKE